MKLGNVNHYLVNWPIFQNKDESFLLIVEKLYESISGNIRKYVDNTMEFVEFVQKEHKIITSESDQISLWKGK
jgi:hypothetical protein